MAWCSGWCLGRAEGLLAPGEGSAPQAIENSIAAALGLAGRDPELPAQLHPGAAHIDPAHEQLPLTGIEICQLLAQPLALGALGLAGDRQLPVPADGGGRGQQIQQAAGRVAVAAVLAERGIQAADPAGAAHLQGLLQPGRITGQPISKAGGGQGLQPLATAGFLEAEHLLVQIPQGAGGAPWAGDPAAPFGSPPGCTGRRSC